jgi:hypothetical protein
MKRTKRTSLEKQILLALLAGAAQTLLIGLWNQTSATPALRRSDDHALQASGGTAIDN